MEKDGGSNLSSVGCKTNPESSLFTISAKPGKISKNERLYFLPIKTCSGDRFPKILFEYLLSLSGVSLSKITVISI